MKLIFDQNISHRIIELLPEQFVGSTSVKIEGLLNANDRQIWNYAKEHVYTIVTQDSDFNDLSKLYGFPPKVIWIRTGNLRTSDILKILVDYYQELVKFNLNEVLGCFEIVRFR
jgi:predicted nuclease of predicted toxin-antitoxin system